MAGTEPNCMDSLEECFADIMWSKALKNETTAHTSHLRLTGRTL